MRRKKAAATAAGENETPPSFDPTRLPVSTTPCSAQRSAWPYVHTQRDYYVTSCSVGRGKKKPSNSHFSLTQTELGKRAVAFLFKGEWNCSHLRIVPPIALEIAAQKGYKYFEAIRFLIIREKRRNVLCHYVRKLECYSQGTLEFSK